VRIEPGKSVQAIKNLSLAEEYLGDHFPQFPVLPGVLMLEAMVQASAWLVRVSEDFQHSVIVLRQARNVSYGNFVAPGDTITVETEAIKIEPQFSSFKSQCLMGGANVVRARLDLEHYNLSDRHPHWAEQDERLLDHFRRQFKLLSGLEAMAAQSASCKAEANQ
jgi:3-hydroxyacyl-[acyl-carrier-protein] dehydratase